MMKYRFILHGERCCACASCQIGCQDLHNEDPNGFHPGNRRIIHLEAACGNGSAEHIYGSAACMHCEDAPCIRSCPKECISRDTETGFVVYDNTGCIGCRLCRRACPYHVPQFRPDDGKMVKCDGCNDRIKSGLSPACVKACPFGALECVPEDAYCPDFDALPELMNRLKQQ